MFGGARSLAGSVLSPLSSLLGCRQLKTALVAVQEAFFFTFTESQRKGAVVWPRVAQHSGSDQYIPTTLS